MGASLCKRAGSEQESSFRSRYPGGNFVTTGGNRDVSREPERKVMQCALRLSYREDLNGIGDEKRGVGGGFDDLNWQALLES